MNKPPLKVAEFVTLLGLMMSLIALSISSILPALPAMGRSLSVDTPNHLQFIVTLFFFGMVFGEVFFGTLSDSLGRKKSLLLSIVVYCCGTIIAGIAQSLEVLLVGRMIQGFGVSGPKAVSVALIRDQYEGNAMAKVMSFVMTIFILVPMIAPTVGQWVQGMAGWRAIFGLFLCQAIAVSVWFAIRQPETLPVERRVAFSIGSIFRSAQTILSNTKTLAYIVIAGLTVGIHFTFVSVSQLMFADFYQVSERFPLYFALLALGIGLASLLNSQLVMRFGMHRLVSVALCVLTGASAGLLMSGFLTQGIPPFLWFMLLFFLIFFSLGILFGNMNALAMQSLGASAGLGASLIGSMSSVLGVVLSVIIGQFYNATIFPIALGFIVLGSVALFLVRSAKRV